MKKNGVLLLILFCCLQKTLGAYLPATITAGFNADIIANGVGAATTSAAAFDIPNNYSLVAADFQELTGNALPTYALPLNGMINSAATSGLSFQLAGYASNNALLLTETTGTGTLNFTASGISDVYFLVVSANGNSDFTATLHFSDATTQTSGTLTASDWFGNPGYAVLGIGRVGLSDNSLDGDNSDPRLYQVSVAVDPANYSKTITSVTFTTTESNGTSMAVLGVSTNSICNGTPATTSTNTSAASVCPGAGFTLSLSGSFMDGGISYQWQSSADNANWSTVANGGTDATFMTTELAATYYRCVVTCAGSGLSASSTSVFVSLNPSNQCYCVPNYTTGCSISSTEFYDINGVVINGENGTSINNTGTGCSATNAFTDYSSSVSPVSLIPYSDYTVTLSTQSTAIPSATIWIDLNDDAVFDDNTERVGTTGSNTSLTLNINAPAAAVGNHRMRITTSFLSSFAITDPCGSYNSGETEDYMINLLPAPTCIHPMNLAAATVNLTDESFTWTAGAFGTTYDYAVDQTASADPDPASTITNTALNNATIASVAPGTTFWFHLRAHCSANDSSFWISKAFTLASTCTNAVTVNVGSTNTGNNASYADVTLPGSACGSTTDANTHGMWYKVTPVTSGTLVFYTVGGTSFDSYLRVFSGNCSTLLCEGFNNDYGNGLQSKVSLTATANTTYYVLLTSNTPSDTGNFTLNIQNGPANDDAVNAIQLIPNAGCSGAAYTNFGASAASGEPYPNCSGFSAVNPVWFKFTAPGNGTAKISTDYTGGTLSDTRIGLFSATDSSDYGTFVLLSCDEDNGVTGAGQLSTLYTTGLTPGATYFVEVDNTFANSSTAQGTFCITVDELNPGMLSTNGIACGDVQQPVGFNGNYNGWVSLVDDNGNLVALVRNSSGGAASAYTASYTVNGSGIRQDANGVYYLNRNYFISNPGISTPVDVQFFFSPGEYGYLNGISGAMGMPVTMADLNVTKQEGSLCEADYSQGLGPISVATQASNNTVNGVGWIQISTSSFSNFYIMGGTNPLSIALKSIDAVNVDNYNKVNWTTASENVGDYFELERSADAKTFSFLAKIASNQKPSDYIFDDKNPLANVNYYRLKMIDAAGKVTYSKTVQATVSGSNAMFAEVYPNPTTKQVTIKVTGTGNGQVTLTDLSGSVLYMATMKGTEMNIDMSMLANGFYLIHYVDDNMNKVIKVGKQ